jgi:hypothetical protein
LTVQAARKNERADGLRRVQLLGGQAIGSTTKPIALAVPMRYLYEADDTAKLLLAYFSLPGGWREEALAAVKGML